MLSRIYNYAQSVKAEPRHPMRQIGRWMGAVLILGYIFWNIDLNQFAEALSQANLTLYFPLIFIFIFIWFLIDSQNLHALFRHYGHRIPYHEIMNVRGLTYLLMVINYNLGVGGMAVTLNQRHNIPLTRTASLMLFYLFIEIIALTFMATIGAIFTMDSSHTITLLMYLSAFICISGTLNVIIFQHLPECRFIRSFKNLNVLESFREIRPASYLAIAFYRGLYFASFSLFFYFGLQTFNIHIPLLSLMAFVPIIFFIGNLPITPAGLGTIQAAMLYFFQDYGTPSAIMAFSITYSTSLILLRIPIGIYYLKKGDILLGQPDASI